MAALNKPDWVSQDMFDYIKSMLSEKIFTPSLALCSAMDLLFKGDDWCEFEYETLLDTFRTAGLPTPTVHVLGQIQCISAIRRGKSFVDKEWNIFEKAAASLTGIPVLFYEKQNLPIEYVYHAMKIINRLGTSEYSEEVWHYIGCEAINDEILWHPIKAIDDAIVAAMARIGKYIGLDPEEVKSVREATEARFKELIEIDVDKINFDKSSIADMMCMNLFRSITIGKALVEIETEAMTKFNGIKDGIMLFNSDGTTTESIVYEDAPAVLDPEVEIYSSDANIDVSDFGDGARELILEKMAELVEVYKFAGLPGVPIETGAPMGGQNTGDDTWYNLSSTPAKDGLAEEVMAEIINENTENDKDEDDLHNDKHEVLDPSSAFSL